MTGECSVALLELALAGRLSGEPEESLHRHLGECEACTRALEQMAGGAAWCQEAASLLMRDDLDHAVPAREEWSNVDFTVEHLEPSDQPDVLGRLGGYDVLEILGRGGTGVVLKGFDRELKRCVAIKVLAPHLAQSSLARKRFAREAQAAAAVVHPNVLAIHQVQPAGRLPFLVMPLVAGESLSGRLVAQGRLELKETLRIGMQAAAGLAAAHEQGLVHRDVKPANILLEKGVERAVLTDFGLARAADDVSMTRWGIIAGTPQYMSPEQARGEPLDGRSDLFSLGCVLYEMATGVSPFRADSTIATLRRLIDDPPPALASLNPELPPWFVGIVERLLEKDPSRRFGSAKEVSELLEGCLAHVQQPASVPLPAAVAVPAARRVSRLRNALLKGGIAMIATLGIGLLGIFLMQSSDPKSKVEPGTPRSADLVGAGAEPAADSAAVAPAPAPPAAAAPATATPGRATGQVYRFDPGMRVGTIACSPDGTLIAVGNDQPTRVMMSAGQSKAADNWQPTVRVLTADAGRLIVSLDLTTNEEDAALAATERVSHIEVTALAFSPGGGVVAVGTSVGQVKLFNAWNGELVLRLDDEKGRLADKKTPENWRSLRRAMGSVASLAFSPDGTTLAACGRSFDDFSSVFDGVERSRELSTGPGRLKVWKVRGGTLQQDLVGHSHATAVGFSPDGYFLASAGNWLDVGEHGTGVILWNPHTGKKMRAIATGANAGTHAFAFSPNGKRVAIGSRVFDKDNDTSTSPVTLTHALSGMMEWRQTVPGWARPAAFSPDGKSVVVLCGGQSIRFLDAETGALKHEIRLADSPQGGQWNDVAVAPEAHRMALGPSHGLALGGVTKDKQGCVEVWDFDAVPAIPLEPH